MVSRNLEKRNGVKSLSLTLLKTSLSSISCGLARPRSFVGGKPTQVAVSHGPTQGGRSHDNATDPFDTEGVTFVEDSSWEPDGVTHHVRFCEGPGVTVGWLRSCGTAGKPGGNREDKHQPVPLGEPGLLTKS